MMTSDALQRVDGILLLNKPYGLTSNAVLQQVKRLYRAKKAGHTGSLDPMATGMLPICFGEATKFCQYLLEADKCYEVTGLLGIKTNTSDAMGEITARTSAFTVSESELLQVISRFLGHSKQVPSMFSALKHRGTPLYKYARAGFDISREARDIIIHDLTLIAFDGHYFSLKVTCSKGTYIRNLVEDIGDALGVGAHVTRLHRCYTAGFAEEAMQTLDELNLKSGDDLAQYLLPIERAVHSFPRVSLDREAAAALREGKVLSHISPPDRVLGCVRLYQDEEHFIGLGDLDLNGALKVRRLLSNQVSFRG